MIAQRSASSQRGAGPKAHAGPQAIARDQQSRHTVTPNPTYTTLVSGARANALTGTGDVKNKHFAANCSVNASFIERIFASGFES
jgi:hypothetical protein